MTLLYHQLEQKQKYAAWKAADIRKALKEGRKPVPGPPGDERDISELSSAQNDTYVRFMLLIICWTSVLFYLKSFQRQTSDSHTLPLIVLHL